MGALAAAGAGGANNLVQSNWIRDKGFGMGRYAPRIVSPITGSEEAAPTGERFDFPVDEANLSRWQVWWKRANVEQFVSFVVIGLIAIFVFSLVAYSTVYGNPDLPDSSGFDFIALESDVLKSDVGNWFGTLFLLVGAVSLFAAALGIVDYVGRLVADVIYVGYTRSSRRWTESRLYFTVVWCLIAFGCTILLLGFDQPLVLLTISTVLGGGLMVIYTCLLLVTNRRYLPKEIALRGYRRLMLIASAPLLGTITVIVAIDQFRQLFWLMHASSRSPSPSRIHASTSGPASSVRWPPVCRAGVRSRSSARRRTSASVERGSAAWRSTHRRSASATSGSHGSPVVKPAPGPATDGGAHGIGARSGSRPSTSTTRSGGISASGRPSSSPW